MSTTHTVKPGDDPTTGIALRSKPSLYSRMVLPDSTATEGRIVLQDENSFPGRTCYRALVSWAWVVLPLTWLLSLQLAMGRTPWPGHRAA